MFFRPTSFPLDLILGNPNSFGPRSHWHWYLSDDEDNSQGSDNDKNKAAVTKKNASKPITYTNAAASVKENENCFTLTFDVPGVKSQDVYIQVDNGVLRLVAERKSGSTVVCKYVQHFLVDEREITTEKIHATLADGVLTLTVPKKEEVAPFQVNVQASDSPALDDTKRLSLTLDCPGFKPNDLQISFHKGYLTVLGEKTTRRIHRQMVLNESKVDVQTLQAYLMDGVLTITIDRHEQNEKHELKKIPVSACAPKQISVDAASKSKDAIHREGSIKDEKIVVETANEDEEDKERAHGDWHTVGKEE